QVLHLSLDLVLGLSDVIGGVFQQEAHGPKAVGAFLETLVAEQVSVQDRLPELIAAAGSSGRSHERLMVGLAEITESGGEYVVLIGQPRQVDLAGFIDLVGMDYEVRGGRLCHEGWSLRAIRKGRFR